MRKSCKKGTIVMSAVLAGAMMLSACGSSSAPAEESTVQEESSAAVVESTSEAAQTAAEKETETASSEETQTTTETESESETETASSEETSKPEPETQVQVETQSSSQETEQESKAAAEGTITSGDFCMAVRGVTIPLGDDMRNYTAQLGEPDAYGSAKSCVEAGDDKVYTYGGVVIYTYITNGADIISLIEIEGSEALPSGIHIGSTKADVIAAYGSGYTEEGTELLYEMGGKTLGLQMNGDSVSFIELFGR